MISARIKGLFHLYRKGLSFVIGLSFFICAPSAFAAMSSSNYMVQWDALSVGSSDTQSSSSYRVRSSVDMGGSSGAMTSSSFALDGGFRGGIFDPVATFQVFSQEISSQVAATALSGTTITVTSASGFAVGDRVLLVQNEGASQVSAMGEISGISGSDITLDALSGGSPVIDGSGGDFLYSMTANGTSLPLPTPNSSEVVTGAIGWEASADVQTGYSVYLMESGALATSGGLSIPDVSDGSVTEGVSEYGAVSSDTSLSGSTFDTQDSAIVSSPLLVASRSEVSLYAREYITLKLATSVVQPGGTYTHDLFVLFVGNY